jgi:hypothetical protein
MSDFEPVLVDPVAAALLDMERWRRRAFAVWLTLGTLAGLLAGLWRAGAALEAATAAGLGGGLIGVLAIEPAVTSLAAGLFAGFVAAHCHRALRRRRWPGLAGRRHGICAGELDVMLRSIDACRR